MIRKKFMNSLAVVMMLLAIILAALFTVFSREEDVVRTFGYSAECSYASLFDKYDVMEVDISMEEALFEEMLSNPTAEEYKACDVTINGETYANVAIRTKGNTSLSQVAASDSDRYSFKIEFDHYDSGQSMEGLDKLVLNNLFCDATYIKEYMAYDIFSFAGVACPYYSFAHITINGEEWGLYLALESMEESFTERVYNTSSGQLYKPESANAGGGKPEMSEQPKMPEMAGQPEQPEGFAGDAEGGERLKMPEMAGQPEQPEGFAGDAEGGERPKMPEMAGQPEQPEGFAGDAEGGEMPEMPGDGFGAGGGADLVYTDDETDSYSDIFDNAVFEPSQKDKEQVIEALKNLSEGENLEQYFDVDACLRYFAAQTFLVNMDSYYSNLKHNYYLYEENGQLTILPWDLNLAFGGFQAAGATDAVNSAIDTPMGGSLEAERPLFSKLMEVEEYKELYHSYLREIVTGYVGSGQCQKTLKAVTAVIDSYVQKDATAFYGYDEYLTAVENLEQFLLLRAASVEGQLNGSIPATTEEQKECSCLIDASGVDLSAMGIQGGDNAGGKGEFGGNMFGKPKRN